MNAVPRHNASRTGNPRELRLNFRESFRSKEYFKHINTIETAVTHQKG